MEWGSTQIANFLDTCTIIVGLLFPLCGVWWQSCGYFAYLFVDLQQAIIGDLEKFCTNDAASMDAFRLSR